MLIKLKGWTLLATSLLLLLLIFGLFQSESIAQDEGAPADGVRLENLSDVDIEFTLKNKDTDWLFPNKILPVGVKEPYLKRDEIKFKQRDGSFTYQKIPLSYVYRIYMNNGWLEIQQVPK